MKRIVSFLIHLSIVSSALAQLPDGGGGFMIEKTNCLDDRQKQEIIRTLKENTNQLQKKGLLNTFPPVSAALPVSSFIWPIRQSAGFSDPGFYGISNYIDEDTSSIVLDYNCGNITYNGHRGTDIFTWPFPWTKMDSNAVQIIAAAAGIIIGKSDGIPDKSCASCTSCDWNAVYVMNQDGSVCWYGHMKTGSQTAKPIGASVAQGEFLGVVGSSGNSTGPHLHFEVYSNSSYTQLLDPWQGPCNKLANPSLWISQLAYKSPFINKIATHNAPPVISSCYGSEAPHYSNQFVPGSIAYFAVYLKDQQPSTSATFTILRPDNSVYSQFTQVLSTYYQASYWYWSYTLPATAPVGTWTFRYQYSGQTVEHRFSVAVAAALPLQLQNFKVANQNSYAQLNWQTSHEQQVSGFDIERSEDGNAYSVIDRVLSTGSEDATANQYAYTDLSVISGLHFYRLKIIDKDGKFTYSPVLSIQLTSTASGIKILGNPVRKELSFLPAEGGAAVIKIVDASGKTYLLQHLLLRANVQVTLPAGNLPNGTYYLVLERGTQWYSIPFSRQ